MRTTFTFLTNTIPIVRILNQSILTRLLPYSDIIAAVEAAMLAFEHDNSLAPQRMHLDMGENTLLVMPARSDTHYGTKLVSVIPGNAGRKLPVTNGAMLLHDAETGLPIALFDAAQLTALRTGALGAIGLKYTTPAALSSIGLIGTGVQGLHQALFAPVVRPIQTVYGLRRSESGFEKLQQEMARQHPGIRVEACAHAEELLEKTNIVIAATNSATPVLPNAPEQLRGKHFISIGSYKPSMQELPDAVYSLAGQIVTDSDFARHETGDIINPLAKGLVPPGAVFSIGKLISGARQLDVAQTTVFKSAGMALFDLFVARAMYAAAVEQNLGQLVEW